MRKALGILCALLLVATQLLSQVALKGTVKAKGTVAIKASSGGGGSCAGGALACDTFTEASNTNLENHTSDSGQTWTLGGSDAGAIQVNGANDWAQANFSFGGDTYAFNYTAASADYQVTFTLKNTISGTTRVCARTTGTWGAGTFSGYCARITSTQRTLQRSDNASFTDLNNDGTAPSLNDTITIRCKGNQISMLVNGSVILGPTTDSLYSGIGKPAIFLFTGGADAVDDLKVENAP